MRAVSQRKNRFVAGIQVNQQPDGVSIGYTQYYDGEVPVPAVYVGGSALILSGVDGPEVIDRHVYSCRHIMRRPGPSGLAIPVLAKATPSNHYMLAHVDTAELFRDFGVIEDGWVRRLRPLHGDAFFRRVLSERGDGPTVQVDKEFITEAAMVSFAPGDAIEVFDERCEYTPGVEINGEPVVESRERYRVAVIAKQGRTLRVFEPKAWVRRKKRILARNSPEMLDPEGTVRIRR